MLELKKAALGIMAIGTILVGACSGNGDPGVHSNDNNHHVHMPFVKHSFPLRQGRFSAVTCLAADNRGHVYAAGFSDENCVLMKLDAELKTLIKMVRFGSAKGGGYYFQDTINDMAIDSQGNIFVAGHTKNEDFPVTKGCYDNNKLLKKDFGLFQGFVTKFSPDLKILASTFIGGDGRDEALAIAIDRHDNVYVAGYSEGMDPGYCQLFVPPSGAFDRKPAPEHQPKALVARLSNDLTTLTAATLLGSDIEKYHGGDKAYDMAIDRDGNVWVAGQTRSVDFPVTPGAVGRKLAGDSDAFVSKFDADLKNLLASTYLGGAKNERANAIVIDAQGRAFVGGWSESADMLVFLDGYDTTHSRNEEDAFIVKLDGRLTHMETGTFLGGEGPADAEGKKTIQGDDKLSCMVLSDDGRTLYVAGRTESRDFDTTRPSRKAHYGNMVLNLVLDRCVYEGDPSTDSDYGDGFIARFDPQLKTRLSSTLFGGSSLDYIRDVLIRGENLYLSGETHSVDFPKMPINYSINATRGFVSCLSKDICQKFPAQKPPVFKPQFDDAELKKIADSLLKDIREHLPNNTMYPLLGKYAKARISRKDFEAKIRRAFFIYDKPSSNVPLKLGIEFHHYNYFQNGKDGYDWIELCYMDRTISHINWTVSTRYTTVYTNPIKGRIVLKIIAKNKKWEIADVDYRGFESETGSRQMKKRLF